MSFADLALGVGRNKSSLTQQVDIIEFAEAPWALNFKLFPVQRVLLKAHYGIALDDTTTFQVTDWRHKSFRVFTEKTYLEMLYSEGRSNIREVIPGHERREMVLSIGRRSGKCVLGDTLVLTDKGVFRIDALGDPYGSEYQDLEIGVAQEGTVKSKSKNFYNGGVKSTRTLKTHCGYELGGTDSHRIKVLAEDGTVQWRYLADLQVGDPVAIHRTSDLWATQYVNVQHLHTTNGLKDLKFPAVLDERWGLLLGYLVGDGSWTIKQRVSITVEHPETWDTLKALYMELFGDFRVQMDKRLKNTGIISLHSVGMRSFLNNLGFVTGTKRDKKMVPWSIMQSPKSVVCAFLRGLFETDGGIESDGHTVSFSTASKLLAHEVQTLLLNLGIVSRVKPKKVKSKVYQILTVRGLRSRKAFADLVGFDSHKKMDPLLKVLGEVAKEGGDTESLPFQRAWCRKLLESIPKENPKSGKGWVRSRMREAFGNVIKPGSPEDLTYSRLRDVLPLALELKADPEAVSHFQRLVEMDYFFDPVESIEEGEHPVFDLCVPDGESFVANGMTNHNTMLASIIAAYETYKLILKGDPQTFYGLPPSNNIQIISVATDKDQAGLLYQEVSGHFKNCGFFKAYTANNTLSYARFQTPEDIDRYGRYADDPTAKATLRVTFRSCIAQGLRGAGNIVVILDEVAHFTDKGQSSAEAVYNAVTPSTSAFSQKDPQDARVPIGPGEGRIISISSPLGRQGQFYKLFQIGMKAGAAAENMLCIQAPTWEVNPSVPASEFEKHYLKDPTVFFTEYGAEFTDRTRGWIERPSDLFECINKENKPTTQPMARSPHFIGIDVGLVNDGTAVAIGHLDDRQQIVLDYVDQIKAGEGEYARQERLDFDDVVDWIYQLSRKFYLAHGVFDQWAGIPFEQALAKRGLRQLQSEHFTKQLNSEVYRNFKDMMWDKRVVLYDFPIESGHEHCSYIEELLELQAEFHSKYITEVHAPNMDGKHDDLSDALTRMVWLASQHVGKPKYIGGTNKNSPMGRAQSMLQNSHEYRQARKRSLRTGSSPDRQPSRIDKNKVRGR